MKTKRDKKDEYKKEGNSFLFSNKSFIFKIYN